MQRSTTIVIGSTVAFIAYASLLGSGRASGQGVDGGPRFLAAPTVMTDSATPLSPSVATLTGSVDTHGLETSAFFRYGTTPSYGAATPPETIAAGLEGHPLEATISGLRFATTYHYQAVAKNTSGEATGADGTFTTPDAVISGTYAVTLTIKHGGRAFGQRAGRKVKRPYRFTAHCGEGLCHWLGLRRRGADGIFDSILHRQMEERYVGIEHTSGRCDNGERFRTSTRIVVSPTGESEGWATNLSGSLVVRARGCVQASEVARLTARRAEG